MLRKAITQFNETGNCEIDIDKVVKYWNLLCRVYDRADGNYILVEYTPKGKRIFKIKISSENANELINRLNLKGIQDDVFKRCKVYLIV